MVTLIISNNISTTRKKGESIDQHINRHQKAVKEAIKN